jgi:hypothetical protein
MPNRTPPAKVIRQLRAEVGFGCPVPDCNSPYLTWHHFDPPWNVKQHHHPKGMVALCPIHHGQADAGIFTIEQLRGFKTARNAAVIKARFGWMRQEIVAVVGGNYYHNVHVPLQVTGRPVISFERDPDGYLLLNLNMLTVSEQPRLRVESNVWSRIGTPVDLECPPSGRKLRVRYENGDALSLDFHTLESAVDFRNSYGVDFGWQDLAFPLATLAINMEIAGRNLRLTPAQTNVGGTVLQGVWMRGGAVGLAIG